MHKVCAWGLVHTGRDAAQLSMRQRRGIAPGIFMATKPPLRWNIMGIRNSSLSKSWRPRGSQISSGCSIEEVRKY